MAKKQAPQSLDLNKHVNKSEDFVNKNKKKIIIAIVAVLALAAAGIGGYTWLKNRDTKAQDQIGRGMDYLIPGVAQNDTESLNKALKGDGGQYIGFLQIANKYSHTDGANLAHAYAGECYAHLGDFKNAIKELEAFSPQGDESVSPAIIGCLADCYANNKQIDKAVETFKKAADMANNESLSPIFLVKAGQLLESQNKQDEAKALYEKVKNDYPNSFYGTPQQQDAEIFIAPEIDKYIERATK